jgi:hypothetical protein
MKYFNTYFIFMSSPRKARIFLALFQVVLLMILWVNHAILPAYSTYSNIPQVEVNKSSEPIIIAGFFQDGWNGLKSGVRTIGDFISLGANTAREAQEASRILGAESRETIRVGGVETRKTLDAFTVNTQTLVGTFSDAYKDNLNVTIDSLDAVTTKKINEVVAAIEKVNELLQDNIKLISKEGQDIIRTSSNEIQVITKQFEESFKNIIVLSAESTAYVIDRTTYNAVTLMSLGMLGTGLIFFIWLLFTRKIPSGIARILAFVFGTIYIGVFGSMALLPPVRAYALINSGIGLEKTLKKYNATDAEKKGKSSSQEILAIISKQLKALTREDINSYLDTMHPGIPLGLEGQKKKVEDVFKIYNLLFINKSIIIDSITEDKAKVRVVQVVKKLSGPSFRNTRNEGIYTLKKYNGKWKIYDFQINKMEFDNINSKKSFQNSEYLVLRQERINIFNKANS